MTERLVVQSFFSSLFCSEDGMHIFMVKVHFVERFYWHKK